MNVVIKDCNINYEITGQGENVLMLHGWGARIESFGPVISELSKEYRVTAFDFPGFGKSDTPETVVDVGWYMELTAELIRKLELGRPNIVCHSFGGRVAILLAATYPGLAGKIVFTDAAGLIKKRSLKFKLKVKKYKICKKALKSNGLKSLLKLMGIDAEKVVKNAGSEDYKQLSGVMRGTFVKVVNQDLQPYLKKIESPSLLIYGRDDEETPVSFGQIMEKEIPDAGLVVLENAGHFSYLDQFARYMSIVRVFLGGK